MNKKFKMKNIICFLTIISLVSCSNRKEIVLQKIENFRSEKKAWDDLTKLILNDKTVNSKLGLLIEPKELDDSLGNELLKKEIVFITVGNNKNCQSVEYQKCWKNAIGTQYLKWTTCDSLKTKKDYYEDLSPIEVFGIGEKCLTWIDTDPI